MPRILIVDDQPDALLAARAALVAAGHDCVLAADGERALELLAGGGFDLLVIDPAMPLHDGWPVLATASALPVVLVSNAAAVTGRLPKPIVAGDLDRGGRRRAGPLTAYLRSVEVTPGGVRGEHRCRARRWWPRRCAGPEAPAVTWAPSDDDAEGVRARRCGVGGPRPPTVRSCRAVA